MKNSEQTIKKSEHPTAILPEKIGCQTAPKSYFNVTFRYTATMNAKKIVAKQIIADEIYVSKITAKKIIAEEILFYSEDFQTMLKNEDNIEISNLTLHNILLRKANVLGGILIDTQIIECDTIEGNIIEAVWADHVKGDESYYVVDIDPNLIKSCENFPRLTKNLDQSSPEEIKFFSPDVFFDKIKYEESSPENPKQHHKAKFLQEDLMKKSEEKDNRETLVSSAGDSLSPTLSPVTSPKSPVQRVKNCERFENDAGENFPKIMLEAGDSPTNNLRLRKGSSPENSRFGARFV